MKIVFTAVPGHGHVNPMVPLARALRRRGHDVTFVTGVEMRARVEDLGFACVPAGPSTQKMQTDALADPAVRELREPWQIAAAIFAGRVGPVLDDLTDVDLDADLIVHDAYDLAGPLLAAARGVPWLTHSLGPRWPTYLEERLGALLADRWANLGVDVPARAGLGHHTYLDICPVDVRADDAITTDPIIELRPEVLDEAPVALPTFGDGTRPCIYATLGTVTNTDTATFRTLLGALGPLDADALLTTGGTIEPGTLGPIPANLRVTDYVPQTQILGSVDLVVCHGGSGTVLGALAHGRPVVALPQGADQFRNAPFWERSGAVRVLGPGELTTPNLADALDASVPDGALRVAAATSAASIHKMPSADTVAERVEQLGAVGP